jgi:hypothetical protein
MWSILAAVGSIVGVFAALILMVFRKPPRPAGAPSEEALQKTAKQLRRVQAVKPSAVNIRESGEEIADEGTASPLLPQTDGSGPPDSSHPRGSYAGHAGADPRNDYSIIRPFHRFSMAVVPIFLFLAFGLTAAWSVFFIWLGHRRLDELSPFVAVSRPAFSDVLLIPPSFFLSTATSAALLFAFFYVLLRRRFSAYAYYEYHRAWAKRRFF